MSRQVKETLLKSGIVEDNVYCHILSGLGAGFFAVICGSPVDVVKSRLMGALCLSYLAASVKVTYGSTAPAYVVVTARLCRAVRLAEVVTGSPPDLRH